MHCPRPSSSHLPSLSFSPSLLFFTLIRLNCDGSTDLQCRPLRQRFTRPLPRECRSQSELPTKMRPSCKTSEQIAILIRGRHQPKNQSPSEFSVTQQVCYTILQVCDTLAVSNEISGWVHADFLLPNMKGNTVGVSHEIRTRAYFWTCFFW